MSQRRTLQLIGIMLLVCMMLSTTTLASGPASPATGIDEASDAKTSHRLIFELESAPLAIYAMEHESLMTDYGGIDLKAPAAQRYLAKLDAEQADALSAVQSVLPKAKLSSYIDETGSQVESRYQVALNGFALDPGTTSLSLKDLSKLPGIKQVYRDYAYSPSLYTSTELINADVLWDYGKAGGREFAGAGVKVASMDGGVHNENPMFDGAAFTYPHGFPNGGLGLQENNNGKIIASRVYFRAWDPPAPGDENPWPGMNGTSHGTHTASTAAGNIVDADYLGLPLPSISGVAPRAWVMSYRVFYYSITGDGSFYTAEGLAALDDIVADGADVLNNSWGGGPSSVGGEFDALDTALRNAWASGMFVSMSAGNAGPGNGTTDHPSDDYIVVAASSTSGTLASGVLNASAPEPVPAELTGMSYSGADFGMVLPLGETLGYPLVAASALAPSNVEGCEPYEEGLFEGKAVLISRGSCYFSDKVRNGQNAGAEMVIVYNNDGDGLINMACGDDCGDITIPSVFIGQTDGEGLVAWCDENGDDAAIELDTHAFQAGNTPDVVVSFSSRGPGAGMVLKPDIAAPGANILAAGYTPGTYGEDRHLGWGQASGTSMAAPHIAGSAALLQQFHPGWSNADIKSALMSTAKYVDVYNYDGSPAQPLDMGAGRVDLAGAVDPGVLLDPPSLSMGAIDMGEEVTIEFQVTNISGATADYVVSTLYTGDGFDAMTGLPGFVVSPTELRLFDGESATITVNFDSAEGQGIGDNQGYIVLEGDTHDAHLPVWGRVLDVPAGKILVIDNDASTTLDNPDYASYYTSTLEALNLDYDYWDADAYFGYATTIPSQAYLSAYDVVIYFTGDNYIPDGYYTVTTPLSEMDTNILTEYVNAGGKIIAMGQDLAAVLNSTDADNAMFFYSSVLGGNYLQDSLSLFMEPLAYVEPVADAPKAMADVMLDLSFAGDGAANQVYIDEIMAEPIIAPDNPEELAPYMPLLKYDGPANMEDGVVAMGHRDEPSFERPGTMYKGSSVYTTFGLEGVNDMPGTTSRADLLSVLLDWVQDEPMVNVHDVTPEGSAVTKFRADLSSPQGATGMSYRWDFGDGSGFVGPYDTPDIGHEYASNGVYEVRVEAVDSFGHTVIGHETIRLPRYVTEISVLPLVFK